MALNDQGAASTTYPLPKKTLQRGLHVCPGFTVGVGVVLQCGHAALAGVGVGETVLHAGVFVELVVRMDGIKACLEQCELFRRDERIRSAVFDIDMGFESVVSSGQSAVSSQQSAVGSRVPVQPLAFSIQHSTFSP